MKIKRSGSLISSCLMLLLAGLGCQSAKKPSATSPAQPSSTPAIQSPSTKQNQGPKLAQSSKPAAPKTATTKPAATKPAAPAAVAQLKPQTPAEPEQPKQVEAKPDPVVVAINKAEKEYQAGEDEYNAGHKEPAKQHFDKAFDLLLASPAEVRADKRFEREYERVLQGSNKVELMEVQQTNNAAEEKSEPAPIDEANEVTNYPVDPNLKAKATAEIKATHSDLPLMMTDQVAGYINYFSTRGRGTLEHGLERSGRYREMIERILKEEGVPQDLIYLAQAESGFHPYAVSRAGARGIWQFM